MASMITTVGDKVKLKNNLIGTVRFIGEIEGKKSVFYGIELNEEKGKNNGSVGKISYFKCKPKRGLFVKQTSIIKTNTKNNLKTPRISVGDKIKYTKGKSDGIIRYIGTPYSIKKSGIYYGVELQRPKGSNNGTVKGTKYFKCKPKYGIFLQSGEFSYHEQKLIKTTPSRPTQKTGSKKKSPKKGKKSVKDIIQKHNDRKQPKNERTKIDDQKSIDDEEVMVQHDKIDEKKKEDEITESINIDDDKAVDDKEIVIEKKKEDETDLFDVMETTMKRLKELMVTKDTEIEHQKKTYQELKEKNQEEMNYMNVLLEEQKRINRMLMDQIHKLEQGQIMEIKNIKEEKEMEDAEDNAISNDIIKENVDNDKQSVITSENQNKDTDQTDQKQKQSKRVPEEDIKSKDTVINQQSESKETKSKDTTSNEQSESKEKEDTENTNNKCVDKKIIKDRGYLVYGYLRRQQRLFNEESVVSRRIVDICNMFYSFKAILRNTHNKYIEIIEEGTRVKSLGIDSVNICCVSNEGFADGIHICSVKCIDCPNERSIDFCGVGHAVGIASKYETDCEFDNLPDAIYYDGYWGIVMNCIGKQKEFKKVKWGKGDVIKIVLDCKEWKITFYKNDEDIGAWSVQRNKVYYLVMQLNSMKGYDYKVLEQYKFHSL